jgi:hypothetical protein
MHPLVERREKNAKVCQFTERSEMIRNRQCIHDIRDNLQERSKLEYETLSPPAVNGVEGKGVVGLNGVGGFKGVLGPSPAFDTLAGLGYPDDLDPKEPLLGVCE